MTNPTERQTRPQECSTQDQARHERPQHTDSADIQDSYRKNLTEDLSPEHLPLGPVVKVRLPENVLAIIDAKADAARLSRSALIRRIIENAI